MDWLAVKASIADVTDLSRDALHLLSGLLGQLALVLIARSWLGALWPWLLILIAAGANEWWDLTSAIWPGEDRARQWYESAKDMVTTMLLPTLMIVVSRYGRAVLLPPPGRSGVAEDGAGADGDDEDQPLLL